MGSENNYCLECERLILSTADNCPYCRRCSVVPANKLISDLKEQNKKLFSDKGWTEAQLTSALSDRDRFKKALEEIRFKFRQDCFASSLDRIAERALAEEE